MDNSEASTVHARKDSGTGEQTDGSQSTLDTGQTTQSGTPTTTNGSQSTMKTDLGDPTTVAQQVDTGDSQLQNNHIGNQTKTEPPVMTGTLVPVVSSEGKLVAMPSEDHKGLVIIDVLRGQQVCSTSGHTDHMTAIAAICNNMGFITGSLDQTVKVWNYENDQLIEKDCIQFDQPVLQLAAHPKNQIIIVCLKGNHVHMRHLANKDVDEVKIELLDSNVTCLVLGDDQLIYGTDMGKAYMWNYEIEDPNQDPVFMLTGHTEPVKFLNVSEERLMTYAMDDSNISIWNLKTGKLKCRLETTCSDYTALALACKVHLAFFGTSDLRLLVYSTRSKEQKAVELLKGNACCLHVQGDNLLVVLESGDVCTFNITEWKDSSDDMDQNANQIDKDQSDDKSDTARDQSNSATCVIL